jgi:hypothetical protein
MDIYHYKIFRKTKLFSWEVNHEGKVRKINNVTCSVECLNKDFQKDKNGYFYLEYGSDDDIKRYYIHELVAEHFIENKPDYLNLYVKHKNSLLTDNWFGNLQYIFLEDAKKKKLPIPVRVKSKSEEKEIEVVKHIEVDYKTYENENEEWKKISKDIEISNFGNMRYFETKTIINKFYVFNGYYYFIHKKAKLYIHKQVALQFLENPSVKNYIVEHIDKDKTNNFYKNLQFISYNSKYRKLQNKKVDEVDEVDKQIKESEEKLKELLEQKKLKKLERLQKRIEKLSKSLEN